MRVGVRESTKSEGRLSKTLRNPATGEEFSTFEDWIEGLVIYVRERIDVARLVPAAYSGTTFPPVQFVE
jgi:hypothetical protein